MTTTYDPEIYLESVTRVIQEYALAGFTRAAHDVNGDDVGENLYDIIMEFPGPILDTVKTVPFEKTLIHFEIDDIQTNLLGFGDNVFAENFDQSSGTIRPQEAKKHEINFDVGIWATDSCGGTTARMRAYQILNELFSGSIATEALRRYSNGGDGPIDILSFSGGRFATERVNDIPVYRTVNSSLVVRCYSRTRIPTLELPAVMDVYVEELTIAFPEGEG